MLACSPWNTSRRHSSSLNMRRSKWCIEINALDGRWASRGNNPKNKLKKNQNQLVLLQDSPHLQAVQSSFSVPVGDSNLMSSCVSQQHPWSTLKMPLAYLRLNFSIVQERLLNLLHRKEENRIWLDQVFSLSPETMFSFPLRKSNIVSGFTGSCYWKDSSIHFLLNSGSWWIWFWDDKKKKK